LPPPIPCRACCCTVLIVSKGAKIVFEHAAAKPDAKLFLKPSEVADTKEFLFGRPPSRHASGNNRNDWCCPRTAGHVGLLAAGSGCIWSAFQADTLVAWSRELRKTILMQSIMFIHFLCCLHRGRNNELLPIRTVVRSRYAI